MGIPKRPDGNTHPNLRRLWDEMSTNVELDSLNRPLFVAKNSAPANFAIYAHVFDDAPSRLKATWTN
jgi:hypothetical protein